MTFISSRNGLRFAVGFFGIIPVTAGLAGMAFGTAMVNGLPTQIDTDSMFRYLSGILLAVGLGFWSTIPEIERTTTRFRLLTVLVLIGGAGRLIGVGMLGVPEWQMVGALVMELVVTPLLCLWQSTIARDGLQLRD